MINNEKLYRDVEKIWEKKGVDTEKEYIKDMIWEVIKDLEENGCDRNTIIHYFNTHRPPKCYRSGCTLC